MDVVPLSVFLTAAKCTPFSKELKNKVKWLLDTYECFHTDRPPVHIEQQRHNRRVRRIGDRDLSTENLTKKSMMMLMNKLSATNKEHIIKQVRNAFRAEYAEMITHTVWEFMLLCPDHQDIYSDVLIMLTPHINMYIHEIWEKFVATDGWIIRVCNMEEYDDFCEYVKLKKRALAAVRGFMQLSKKNILPPSVMEILANKVHEQCDQEIKGCSPESMKKVELLLEEVAILPTPPPQIKDWLELASTLPPSIRFKIYDINDRCSKTRS